VSRGCRRLHDDELHNLNTSPHIIKVIRSRRMRHGACSTHGRDEKCQQYLVRKPEGKRPLKRPRCRWEDNIRMDLKEIGKVGTGFIWLRRGTSGGVMLTW
jgi:hypothetical protein